MLAIPLAEFQKMSATEIKVLPCCKITDNGSMVGYLFIGTSGNMPSRLEAVASTINASRGVSGIIPVKEKTIVAKTVEQLEWPELLALKKELGIQGQMKRPEIEAAIKAKQV
jgi:hypothetical protein